MNNEQYKQFFRSHFRLKRNNIVQLSQYILNLHSFTQLTFISWQTNIIILITRFSLILKEGRLFKNYPSGVCLKLHIFWISKSFFNFQMEYFPNKNLSKCRFKKIRRDDPCTYMKQGDVQLWNPVYCFRTTGTVRYTPHIALVYTYLEATLRRTIDRWSLVVALTVPFIKTFNLCFYYLFLFFFRNYWGGDRRPCRPCPNNAQQYHIAVLSLLSHSREQGLKKIL